MTRAGRMARPPRYFDSLTSFWHIVAVILAFGLCMRCVVGGGFISLKDVSFVGSDGALVAALAGRLAAARAPPLRTPALDPADMDPRVLHLDVDYEDDTDQLNITRRKFSQMGKDHSFIYRTGQYPSEGQVELMTMKLMEQACYAAQYRLKDADRHIKKYDSDPRFRIAYAFEKLNEWERDLHFMYSFVTNWTHRGQPDQFRMWRHVKCYTHAVRKMIDVTYTKELIVDLSNQIILNEEKYIDKDG